jgi:hypothetical protein
MGCSPITKEDCLRNYCNSLGSPYWSPENMRETIMRNKFSSRNSMCDMIFVKARFMYSSIIKSTIEQKHFNKIYLITDNKTWEISPEIELAFLVSQHQRDASPNLFCQLPNEAGLHL